jgi:hypothetical protein
MATRTLVVDVVTDPGWLALEAATLALRSATVGGTVTLTTPTVVAFALVVALDSRSPSIHANANARARCFRLSC